MVTVFLSEVTLSVNTNALDTVLHVSFCDERYYRRNQTTPPTYQETSHVKTYLDFVKQN
ncbi:MAG: hypothetical protein QXX20_01855 [Candidatus Thermoplasmatota archaeon]